MTNALRLLAVLVVAAVSLVGSSAAQAASVKINGSTLEYDAGLNEENDVTIEQGLPPYAADTYTISELGFKLNAAGDAIELNSTNCNLKVDTDGDDIPDKNGPADTDGDGFNDTAVCSTAGVNLISADLTDGNTVELDEITLGFDTEVTTNATIVTGPGEDTILGGSGNDDINGGADDDDIAGSDGNDRLTGGPGGDSLEGDAGDDTYVADATEDGSDSIADFGDDDDIDTADYSARSAPVNVTLDDNDNDGGSGGLEGDDAGSEIERVFGGSAGDTIVGSPTDNVLRGNGGNDSLGGAGGSDTADYSNAVSPITVDLSNSSQQNTVGAGLDTLVDLENVSGGSGGDTLTGSPVANEISGAGGNDTINTRDFSSDSIDCGAAIDSLVSDTNDLQTGCESVDNGTTAPPSGGSGAAPPVVAVDRTAPSVSLASKSPKMAKNGSIKITLRCPSGESSCSGSLMLSGRAQVGSAVFTGIPGGGSRLVTIKLSAKAKKQVKKKKKLAVKLKITARDSAGNVGTTSASLTIKK